MIREMSSKVTTKIIIFMCVCQKILYSSILYRLLLKNFVFNSCRRECLKKMELKDIFKKK